jgi:hypothetical protein
MRACSTNLARSMGYLSTPSADERLNGSNVVVMGPASGEVRSYHQSGTSRDAYMKARAALSIKRRGRTILYAA